MTDQTAGDPPAPVTIVDVAPRDGLQSDGLIVSTEAKLELIERIVRAGIRRVETTSFVNPARVPQMADAAEVMAGLAARRAESPAGDPLREASFIGLVLNRRGLDRALEAGCDEVNAVVVVSDTFSERNQGTTTDEGIAAVLAAVREAPGRLYGLVNVAGGAAPSTWMPLGLAMISSAFWPAISMKPLSWLGALLLTSLRMTRAPPVASQGLPCTQPPSWVLTSVRELFRMTPRPSTSNWL